MTGQRQQEKIVHMQKMMMRDVVTWKLAGLRKVHCQITMRWLTFQPNPPTFIVVCLFELIHYSNHIFFFAAQSGIPYIFQIIGNMFKKGTNSFKMFPSFFTFKIQLIHYQHLISVHGNNLMYITTINFLNTFRLFWDNVFCSSVIPWWEKIWLTLLFVL